MSKSVALSVVLVVAVGTSGCMVAKSKYDMAVEETRTVQAELEKVQAQKSALEQQVKSLKDASGKLVSDVELAQAELQRLRDSRDRERAGVEGRVKEQEQKIKELLNQQRSLRQDIEGAKQRNETLRAAVARYQKELKERQHAMEPAAAPAPMAPRPPQPPAPAQAIPAPKPPTEQAKPQPSVAPMPAPVAQPSVAPVPTAPQAGGLAPVNINVASANDMVLFLGLPKEVAERVVSNRPYKVRGELVARNVLPKATFDVIKDRITVTP